MEKLLDRIRSVGRQLITAQPRELVVGNMVRRVLGLVREVAEYETEPQPAKDVPQRPTLPSHISTFSPLKHGAAQPTETALEPEEDKDEPAEQSSRPPLLTSHTSYAQPSAPTVTSLFDLFSHPSTPRQGLSPQIKPETPGRSKLDKPEVLEGVREIADELDQVDKQISEFALEQIHENEVILTHDASLTVHKFLHAAAKKRKFTVFTIEGYPNDSVETHSALLHGPTPEDEDSKYQPLTALGIKMVMHPDSAVLDIMSRVNKVILPAQKVLPDGSFVAAAGAENIAMAAKTHRRPVIVLSGVHNLSPVLPSDVEDLIEYGDPSSVLPYQERDVDWVEKVEVMNPLNDYVPADRVDLYITNLGGHAPSDLHRIVADQYNAEDITL